MKNPITKQIFSHLEFLGYQVKEISEESEMDNDYLVAESESKSNLILSIYKNSSVSISTRYTFSDSKAAVTQRFLDALNSENAKSIYSKVYYREKEDKKVVLEIETFVVGYEKQAFVMVIDSLEREVGIYLRNLKEYYSEK